MATKTEDKINIALKDKHQKDTMSSDKMTCTQDAPVQNVDNLKLESSHGDAAIKNGVIDEDFMSGDRIEQSLSKLERLGEELSELMDDALHMQTNTKERLWKIKNNMHLVVNVLIECSCSEQTTDICQRFCSQSGVFKKVYGWTGRHRDCLKQMSCEQLSYFANIIGMGGSSLLSCQDITIPMFLLLLSLKPSDKRKVPPDIEILYVKLLYAISQRISDKLFFAFLSEDNFTEEGFCIPKFTFFELLIMYTHQTGQVGDMARSGILDCMQVSKKNKVFLKYVVEESAGCVVIAGGLSARYSSLPTSLEIHTDDWHQITAQEVASMSELRAFLQALNFCCDVMMAADGKIQHHLSVLIHDGFLMSVLAPALNQSMVDAQTAVIVYLELFLRQISSEQVMEIFLKVLLTDAYDNKPIIDLLIQHINSTSIQLCMVTIQLFRTLLELNCEDVMFHLILRYLLPCNHILPNQKRTIKEVDFYCKSATMFLYLTPSVCVEATKEPALVEDGETVSQRSRLDSYPRSLRNPSSNSLHPPLQSKSSTGSTHSDQSKTDSNSSRSRSSSNKSCTGSNELSIDDSFETTVDFMAYLDDARTTISSCKQACMCWSAVYDGMDVVTERSPRKASARLSDSGHTLDRSPSVSSTGTQEIAILRKTESNASSYSQDGRSSSSFLRSNSSASVDSDLSPGIPDMSHVRFTTECLGPFINAVFDRLEDMMENNLYVNLQLTGLLSRLACYPQPLLRSFLLNSNLVVQPGVRSFTKILSQLSAATDAFMMQVDDYKLLIFKARRNLMYRELNCSPSPAPSLKDDESNTEEMYSVNVNTVTGGTTFRRESFNDQNGSVAQFDITSLHENQLQRSASVSVNTSIVKEQGSDRRMTVAGPPGHGGKLHPVLPRFRTQGSRSSKSIPTKREVAVLRQKNPSLIRNVVYCAVVLEEFVKELAAISMEQTLH